MQRLEAKNPRERPLFTAETRNAQNRQQDPRGNGLFSIDDGFYRSGTDRDRTCDPYHVNEAAEAKIALQSVTYGRVHRRTSVDHSQNGSCATRKSRANFPPVAAWRGHYHPVAQPGQSRPFAESGAIRGCIMHPPDSEMRSPADCWNPGSA